jgi:hypothetical protein
MREKNLLYNIALILFTIPTFLFSQQMNTVSIYGTVTDSASGQVLQGILVEAIDEADTSQRASNITDQNGNYSINLSIAVAQLVSEFRLTQNYPNPLMFN